MKEKLTISFKILVIEHDDFKRQEMLDELSKTGFEVIGEKHGHNTETMMERFKPDIIYMNLDMPRLSGSVVIRKIRKHEYFNKIPIAVIALNVNKNLLSELQNLDVKEILKLPFQEDQLIKSAEKFYRMKVIREVSL